MRVVLAESMAKTVDVLSRRAISLDIILIDWMEAELRRLFSDFSFSTRCATSNSTCYTCQQWIALCSSVVLTACVRSRTVEAKLFRSPPRSRRPSMVSLSFRTSCRRSVLSVVKASASPSKRFQARSVDARFCLSTLIRSDFSTSHSSCCSTFACEVAFDVSSICDELISDLQYSTSA